MNRILLIALAVAFATPAIAAGDVASGQAKAQACAACHGPGGNAPVSPDFPRLAGQYYDYLFKSLRDYKSGTRKNPIMAGQVANLKTQDMADLAAFFASQQGKLYTVPQ